MKLMSYFIMCVSLGAIGLRAAALGMCEGSYESQQNDFQNRKTCSDLNLREAAVCTYCTTSKNAVFQLYSRDGGGNEVWFDLDAQALWGVRLSKDSSWYDARAACIEYSNSTAVGNLKNSIFSLPKKEDFERAEANGFREVVKAHSNFFWTTTRDPNNSDYALIFSGSYGYLYSNTLGYQDNSVRCIGH